MPGTVADITVTKTHALPLPRSLSYGVESLTCTNRQIKIYLDVQFLPQNFLSLSHHPITHTKPAPITVSATLVNGTCLLPVVQAKDTGVIPDFRF